MTLPLPLTELSEKQWQKQIVDLAAQLGWRKTYHVYDSRRSHSGWPDLVLLRDRIVYVEVKTERGKLSDTQKDWLNAIVNAKGEAYVARPRDLEFLAYVLTARHRPQGHALEVSTYRELGRPVEAVAA